MYRQLLLVTAFCAALNCGAQVTATLQLPPSGVLLKKQLWNMALVYTGNTPLKVKINLTLSAAAGDQPLLTALTPLILLNKGARQIQAADVSPLQYHYFSSAIADRDPDGYLPVGSYQACYTIELGDEQGTPLTEDCVSFEVEPLSPPELNTPADEDTLVTTLPQFTWVPPSPVSLFSNLSYKFNLVEIRPGQSATDAMQQNIPIYSSQNCTDIFINYPGSALALDTGKQYAWQVVAQNNLQPSVQSEIWTFRIKGFAPANTSSGGNYIQLKGAGETGGVYTVDNGVIGIKYYSYDKDHLASMTFSDAGRHVIAIKNQPVKYGDNYISYALGKGFKQGQLYFVQIADSHNNPFTAAFRIK